jgi:hypothetical protein
MKFFDIIKSVGKEHWGTASWLLAYTIIFGAGPILVSLIVKSLFGNVDFYYFIDNGQAVIFSAALISSGFYFVGKDFKNVFPGRLGFMLLFGLIWMVIFGIFTCIILYNSLGISTPKIKWELVRSWSIGLVISSLIIVYFAAAINEWRIETHYKTKTYQTGTGRLEEDFDRNRSVS